MRITNVPRLISNLLCGSLLLGCYNSATNADELAEIVGNRFKIDGRDAFTILPNEKNRKEPIPWVMYAPTFEGSLPNERDEGWMMRRFLDAGIAIAGVDVGESYGSPAGRKTYSKLHEHLTSQSPRFATKACLLARSRGGLMLYNWAAENPSKVQCIAGIYPVCDLQSYPGLARACAAYGLNETQLRKVLSKHNPVDRLSALAKAKIPILHIHGDVDKVVPLEANSQTIATRYKTLGGKMRLITAPDQGHNMWRGFFECEELTDFVIANANRKVKSQDPALTPATE